MYLNILVYLLGKIENCQKFWITGNAAQLQADTVLYTELPAHQPSKWNHKIIISPHISQLYIKATVEATSLNTPIIYKFQTNKCDKYKKLYVYTTRKLYFINAWKEQIALSLPVLKEPIPILHHYIKYHTKLSAQYLGKAPLSKRFKF
jgi:hypothetical protein